MATAKYYRGIGPLWQLERLQAELEAALGQPVTAVISDGTTLEIEYTVPNGQTVIDEVVRRHIAELAYTVRRPGGKLLSRSGQYIIRAPKDFLQEVLFLTELDEQIAALDAGYIDGSLSGIILVAYAKSASEHGISAMQAYNNDQTVGMTFLIQHDGRIRTNWGGVIHDVHHGESENYLKVTDTTETSIAYTSIPAGAMGTTGRVKLKVFFLVKNNKGSAGTFTLTFYFGTKSITLRSAVAINDSATSRCHMYIEAEVVNDGAANAQHITIWQAYRDNAVANGFNAPTWEQAWNTAAIDTDAAATDFKVNITLSANNAAFFCESSGEYSGAYGTYS